MKYLGIDYGSRAIKAVGIDDSGKIGNLPLGQMKYVPNLCRISGSEGIEHPLPLLQAAFTGDPSVPINAFAPFLRDQAISPTDTATAARKKIAAIDVHAWPCAAIRQAVTPHSSQIGGVVVSIPDQWRTSVLALPVAMARHQLAPLALVPESLAALVAECGRDQDQTFLCVSLGAGSLRVAIASLNDEQLAIEHAWSIPSLGGRGLRQMMRSNIAEEVAKRTRRLVLEDRTALNQLDQWLDRCLSEVGLRGDFSEPLILYGETVVEQRWDVATLLGNISQVALNDLDMILQEVVARCKQRTKALVWGEIAFFFHRLITPRLGSSFDVRLGDLDCVARGCAMIAKDLCSGVRGYFEGNTRVIRTSDGGRTFRTDLSGDVVPVLSPLHQPSATAPRTRYWLQPQGGATTERIAVGKGALRIGRDPRSEVIIDEQRFPMVSMAHAMIVLRDQQAMVRDLGSSNGTFVNEALVNEAPLKPGDIIRLGKSGPEFQFLEG